MVKVRVWDLPTRLFHWLLVAAVVGLVVTGNVGGNWINWHMRLGYLVFSLVLFRLVWGVLGGNGPGSLRLCQARVACWPIFAARVAGIPWGTTRWEPCRCWHCWRCCRRKWRRG